MKRVAVSRDVGNRFFQSNFTRPPLNCTSITPFSRDAVNFVKIPLLGPSGVLRLSSQAAVPTFSTSGNNYYRARASSLLPVAALVLVTAAVSVSAQCESLSAPTSMIDEATMARRKENVKRYVDELVLKTDTASYIPQVIEKEIYYGVLMLVVSMLHGAVIQMHGTNVLGHKLEVLLRETTLPPVAKGIFIPDFGPVADMFLQDSELNVGVIPDFIERQLYVNILSMLYGLMHEISQSADIQTMGMKLGLQLTPTVEKFENVGKFSNKFEIDPSTVDEQLIEAGVVLNGGHIYSALQEKMYRDFFVFLLSCVAAILDTTSMKVFDVDMNLKLGKLDELPHMEGLQPVKVSATNHKPVLLEELKALRNEESLIRQRTARRLIEVESRKKEIKRLMRLRIEEMDESISVKSIVSLDASHPSRGQHNAS